MARNWQATEISPRAAQDHSTEKIDTPTSTSPASTTTPDGSEIARNTKHRSSASQESKTVDGGVQLTNIAANAVSTATLDFATALPSNSIQGVANLYTDSDPSTRPNDIFYPIHQPQGPVFLDEGGCTCSLRKAPDNIATMWRCIGNNTMDPYDGNTGKWFNIENAQAVWTGRDVWDGSDQPINLQTPLVALDSDKPSSTNSLVASTALSAAKLSVYDGACTGKNRTSFSTSLYQTVREQKANQEPISAALCFRQGAIPIEMVNASRWLDSGCPSGFFCPNNTINSLPQYCVPLEACQKARLSGVTCTFNAVNFPMGQFEPVVCTAGYFCPQPGLEQIRCPAGTYCPEGSSFPRKCHFGSYCPNGVQAEYEILPLIVLLVIDSILIAGILFTNWFLGIHSHRRGEMQRLKTLEPQSARYGMLHDDTELADLDEYTRDAQPGSSGFAGALQDPRASRLKVEASPELQTFIYSMKTAIQGAHFGLSFTYENLEFHPNKAAKPVLNNLSGTIQAGALCAVMGGSGAGKSTFVNVLMGKQSHTGGRVYVNGAPGKMKQYKKIIGYVPQDDIVIPELTVRENILHSARIRLPKRWSAKEIASHVDSVIDCLEIAHVKDSRVGTIAKPVISGGQRKRVSIGMELAAAPMSLFLDEPTSGLDATSAGSMMRMLKALSRLGISVIVIIHQPRMEIFEIIDELLLLGDGHTIYQGAQNEVEGYFRELGYHAPENANMSDVITDIITGHGRIYKSQGDVTKTSLIESWKANHLDTEGLTPRTTGLHETSALRKSVKDRGAPFNRQMYYCLTRAMIQQWRLISSFWFEMAVAAIAGFLIGLAQNARKGRLFTSYFKEEYALLSTSTYFNGIPELALLTCVAIGLIASSPAVKLFAEEKLIYRREAEAGHSRLAYYVAKVFSTVPRIVLGNLHFSVLLHLLSTPTMPFHSAYLINFLYLYCIYGFASIVAMIVRREDAPLIAVMSSLIIAVLSGAAPPLARVISWHMEWLWRASPGTWMVEAYWDRNVAPWEQLYQVSVATAATGLRTGYFSLDCWMLLLLGCVYRIVAFGGLLLSPKFMA